MLDLNALLLATAMSGLCLSGTMVAYWLANRGGGFLVMWSIGVMIVVVHLVAFWMYASGYGRMYGLLACLLLPVSGACIYASARQFADAKPPLRVVLAISIPYVLLVTPIHMTGYDGVALIVQYAVAATLMGLCAVAFWGKRTEAPITLTALSAVYVTLGVSFALCGAVLLAGAQWHIGVAPNNWAEDINVIVAVIGMTGTGALTLSIDQSRLAYRHEADARTDALTGLMNRRALTEANALPLGPRTAIVLFDLDHFKRVNDRHGHAAGDEVIRRFGAVARDNSRRSDQVARLGGEEFAIVMHDVTLDLARKVAEGIVARFAEIEFSAGSGAKFRCTASAGIACGNTAGAQLSDVLSRADSALYAAKRGGRNRIDVDTIRLVS